MYLNFNFPQPVTPEDTLQQLGQARGHFAHTYTYGTINKSEV